MVMRVITQYLLLGHILIARVRSECFPSHCLKCNVTAESLADTCPLCPHLAADCVNVTSDLTSHCKKDFWVFVNSTGSNVQEGSAITLTCFHNLFDLNVTFGWKKDGEEIKGDVDKSQLTLQKVFVPHAGQYRCTVSSSCGIYESSPHDVTVNSSSVIILVICGVSALGLVVTIGVCMKFKLKRDNAKHRERMKQRAQIEQCGGPAPVTPMRS